MGKKSSVGKSSIVENVVPPIVVNGDENRIAINVRPFLLRDYEIDALSPRFKEIALAKKEGAALSRGMSMLMWKFIIGTHKAQKEPFILKYDRSTQICKLCGCVTAWSARCSWFDRFYNRETDKKETRQFIIDCVCENCLIGGSARYLHHAAWLKLILDCREKAQYAAMHNAKSYQCVICEEHATDSTWVHIPYENMMLTIPVCDRHFDAIIGYVPVPEENFISSATQWKKEGLLSQSVYDMCASYAPVRNKKVVKND